MIPLGKTVRVVRLAFIHALLLITFCPAGFAEDSIPLAHPAARQQRGPEFLAKNYYLVKITRSYPNTENRLGLDADGVGYGLGYTFTIGQRYLVSLVAGFHNLIHTETESSFGYFTIYNESLRLFRLYHPLYFSIGGRIGYMVPTLGSTLPLKQNKAFENEVMVGGSAGLSYVLTKRILVSSQLGVWGGSNSSKHMVIDFAANVRVAL